MATNPCCAYWISNMPKLQVMKLWQHRKDGQPVRLRVWFRGFQPELAFLFLPWFFDVDD